MQDSQIWIKYTVKRTKWCNIEIPRGWVSQRTLRKKLFVKDGEVLEEKTSKWDIDSVQSKCLFFYYRNLRGTLIAADILKAIAKNCRGRWGINWSHEIIFQFALTLCQFHCPRWRDTAFVQKKVHVSSLALQIHIGYGQFPGPQNEASSILF